MKISVIREACCGADDQSNRLDATYEVEDSATLEVLLQKICSSNFLQYSSSHNRLTVEVAGRKVAEVPSYGDPKWNFDASPTEAVAAVIGKNTLRFFFEL